MRRWLEFEGRSNPARLLDNADCEALVYHRSLAGVVREVLPGLPLVSVMVLSQTLGGILLPFMLVFMVLLIGGFVLIKYVLR